MEDVLIRIGDSKVSLDYISPGLEATIVVVWNKREGNLALQ